MALTDEISYALRVFSRDSVLRATSEIKLLTDVCARVCAGLTSSRDNIENVEIVICFKFLCTALQSANHSWIQGAILGVIDLLPSLFETAAVQHNADDLEGSSSFILAVIRHGSPEALMRLGKVLPKIVQVTLRLLAQSTLCTDEEVVVAREVRRQSIMLALLFDLLCSMRHLLSSSLSSIRYVCVSLLTIPAIAVPAAKTLAASFAFESTDVWTVHWQSHVSELLRLLRCIGALPRSVVEAGQSGICIIESCSPENLKLLDREQASRSNAGRKKALLIEHAFAGICACLVEMCRVGCSSGAVASNLNVFLKVLSFTLDANVDAHPSDAKSSIENHEGITPMQLSAIFPQLKLSILLVAEELLATNHPSLFRCASAFIRPISSTLSARNTKRIPALAKSAVRTLAQCVCCFPAAVVRLASQDGLGAISGMFSAEIDHLTASQNSVNLVTVQAEIDSAQRVAAATEGVQAVFGELKGPRAADSKTGGSVMTASVSTENLGVTAAGLREVIEACETMLLFCGPQLPVAVRDELERGVARALACMAKGLQPPQYPDRRMQRSVCELLRRCPPAQKLILQLAAAEVLSPRSNGLVSGNIPLLRVVCEMCMRQKDTATEASRVFLIIDAILHPVSITMPSVSAIANATRLINGAENGTLAVPLQQQHVDATLQLIVDNSITEHDKKKERRLSEDVIPFRDNITKKQKKANASDHSEEERAKQIPLSVDYSFTITNTTADVGEDDDNDIPDLDIDADPDSNQM